MLVPQTTTPTATCAVQPLHFDCNDANAFERNAPSSPLSPPLALPLPRRCFLLLLWWLLLSLWSPPLPLLPAPLPAPAACSLLSAGLPSPIRLGRGRLRLRLRLRLALALGLADRRRRRRGDRLLCRRSRLRRRRWSRSRSRSRCERSRLLCRLRSSRRSLCLSLCPRRGGDRDLLWWCDRRLRWWRRRPPLRLRLRLLRRRGERLREREPRRLSERCLASASAWGSVDSAVAVVAAPADASDFRGWRPHREPLWTHT